jgi:hypothetical protein
MEVDDNAPPVRRVYDVETMISRLARDIARNLITVTEVRERYQLDDFEFDRLLKSPFFAVRFEEELAEWNAGTAKAGEQRVQAKSLTMIEESLPEIFALIHDKNQPMGAKIQALQWASNVAGLVKKDAPAGLDGRNASDRIRFNIFIDNKKVSFDKPIDEVPSKVIDGTATLVDKEV